MGETKKNTNWVEQLLSWLRCIAAPLVGGIVACVAYIGVTPDELVGPIPAIRVGVILFVIACFLRWRAVEIGQDTLGTPNQTTGRVLLVMGCIVLVSMWTICIVLRLVLIGHVENSVYFFYSSEAAVLLLAEWALSILWLFLVAFGASGHGPLRGLASRVAREAVDVGQLDWAPKQHPSHLEKRAEKLYRELHPEERRRFWKCSTKGCFNYSYATIPIKAERGHAWIGAIFGGLVPLVWAALMWWLR